MEKNGSIDPSPLKAYPLPQKSFFFKSSIWIFTVSVILACFTCGPVFGNDDSIGSIKTLEGEVRIVRQNQEIPAKTGTFVFVKDIIKTGKQSSAGIIFRDDSMISMGPESMLDLEQYVFEPKESLFSVIIDMMKGTFVYISGVIGKLSPESIRLTTPDTVIAIRGTEVLIKVRQI